MQTTQKYFFMGLPCLRDARKYLYKDIPAYLENHTLNRKMNPNGG